MLKSQCHIVAFDDESVLRVVMATLGGIEKRARDESLTYLARTLWRQGHIDPFILSREQVAALPATLRRRVHTSLLSMVVDSPARDAVPDNGWLRVMRHKDAVVALLLLHWQGARHNGMVSAFAVGVSDKSPARWTKAPDASMPLAAVAQVLRDGGL